MARKQTPFRLAPDVRQRLEQEASRLGLSLNGALNVVLDRCLPSSSNTVPNNPDPLMPAAPEPITDPDNEDDAPINWPTRS